MNSRTWLAAAALAAALAALPSPAGAASTSNHRLKAFGSCSRFVHYARRHALNELRTRGVPSPVPLPVRAPQPMTNDGAMPVQGEAAPALPAAGQDFSTTNVQEGGVDEPDSVKTDGKTIFVAQYGRLYAIDAQSSPPKLLGSIALAGSDLQLLLSGDRLLVMSGQPVYAELAPAPVRAAMAPPTGRQASTLTLVDVSNPGAMKVVQTMAVGGGYLSARMTGQTARVIFSATPQVLPALQTTQAAAQRPQIARTTTPDWRPSYRLRRGRTGKIARRALVRCTSIQRPAVFSGLNSLTVLTIDIGKGLDPVDSDGVMTDGQTVYASKDSLYVATQKAIAEQPNGERPPPEQQTEIHEFDTSKPDATIYEGSGVVTGALLNQYSLSEQDGYLRVASTNAPLWWSPGNDQPSESFVTVLKQDGGALKRVGRVGGLGKGERIYAVRFLGDVGYVVTFRQVDPLYTIALSDPENPKLLGSLDLLGYSAYLHPVGDGLLLGVGQSATADGRTQGTQVSLFDVSDPAAPARLSNKLVGTGSSSSVEFDPHAFLWWDPLRLAVLPVQVYDEGSQFSGAIGFHATKPDGVTEAGRLQHPSDTGYSSPVTRSLVVGQRLFTVSDAGVLASDLATFAERGFVAFPAPEPPTPQPMTSPPSGR
ncbi:MAG TPA: beta-propeller domain-containing protein [Thermoleophilaceae bacterium]|nr:beta-propeller domain-containing protein [Thermoleophilaceae bacterium]